MNQTLLFFCALFGGMCLAAQGGLNAQLGMFLKHPLLASFVAFMGSSFFALLAVLLLVKEFPSKSQIMEVPWYLWGSGAFLSLTGISLYYYTIPKLGVSNMIVIGLFGQLLFAMLAGHYAWFQLPKESITPYRIVGILSIMVGIILMKIK